MPLENRTNGNNINGKAISRALRQATSRNENLPGAERTTETLQRQMAAQEDANKALIREKKKLFDELQLEKQRNRQNGWITTNIIAAENQMELDELRVVNQDLKAEIRDRMEEREDIIDELRELVAQYEVLMEANNRLEDRIDAQNDQIQKHDAVVKVLEEQRDFFEDEAKSFKRAFEEKAKACVDLEVGIAERSQLVGAKEEENRELQDMLLAKNNHIMELERERDEQFDTAHRESAFFSTLVETQSQSMKNDLEVRNTNQARDLTNANNFIAMDLERNERCSYASLEEAYHNCLIELQRLQKQSVAQMEQLVVAEKIIQGSLPNFRQ